MRKSWQLGGLICAAGVATVMVLAGSVQADEEIVATVGQKRVRARVDASSGKVEAAQMEQKAAPASDSWEVSDPETDIVEDTIEESNAGDIEFDDCNNNGIDDLIEIADGLAVDVNGNLVPDSCEFDFGDLNLDQEIDGADLFIILGWYAAPYPLFGDLNHDGVVNSEDMGLLLVRWGPTPF